MKVCVAGLKFQLYNVKLPKAPMQYLQRLSGQVVGCEPALHQGLAFILYNNVSFSRQTILACALPRIAIMAATTPLTAKRTAADATCK